MGEKHVSGLRKRMWTCRGAILVSAVLLAATAPTFAQNAARAARTAPACGPEGEQFVVKTDFGDHPLEKQEGKAVVYFLQDDGRIPRPTVRWGIDGAWAGATHSQSYFHVVVDSGDRHLCAAWHWTIGGNQIALLHFTAEPGRVYYFRARSYHTDPPEQRETELTAVDSDQGQFLAGRYSYSSSRTKK